MFSTSSLKACHLLCRRCALGDVFSVCSSFRKRRLVYNTLAPEKQQDCLFYSPSRQLNVSASIVSRAPFAVQPYLRLIRADKPTAGAFFMRGAGCIINDLWDQDYDSRVERTKSRPLACGEITPKQAVVCLGGLLSCALCVLLQLNWPSVFLGASSLILVVSYPLAKRYTYWPQAILGLTFNWGCLLGWSAVQGSCFLPSVLPLYVAGISWTLLYDTVYAHQDKSDDLIVGVKSTALLFGDRTKLWLSGFATGMVASLATAGLMTDQTWPFYCGVGLISGHLTWQILTLNINDTESCWKKFKSNQHVGILVFLSILLGTLCKYKPEENSETSSR